MIKLHEVSKQFGDHLAVDQVSLEVKPGEKHVLIGTSGSGKTTLLKMINKLIPKSEGQIIVNGINLQDWGDDDLRRRLGYVIQEVGLFPHFTIEQNIGVVPHILKWPVDKIAERTRLLMSMVGLPERIRNAYPGALSGGQQQRVGIARALAADPEVLLMDEPFGALDPITRSDLQQEFVQLPGIDNKTVVIVTHDMVEAALLGEIITVMDKGKIQQSGTLSELLFCPANDFVKGFLTAHRSQLEIHAITIGQLTEYFTESSEKQIVKISPDCQLDELPDQTLFQVKIDSTWYSTTRDECLAVFFRNRESIIAKCSKHG